MATATSAPAKHNPALVAIKSIPCSLSLPAELPEKNWLDIGRGLHRAEQNIQWLIGDWWNYGHVYGHRKAVVDADDWDGPDCQTCRNAGWVARAFEPSRRRDSLGFSHHAEVASLPPAEAEELLNWCEEPIIETGKPRTVRELRAERQRRDEAERAESVKNVTHTGGGITIYPVKRTLKPWPPTPDYIPAPTREGATPPPRNALLTIDHDDHADRSDCLTRLRVMLDAASRELGRDVVVACLRDWIGE
jgi:hypothetical protein